MSVFKKNQADEGDLEDDEEDFEIEEYEEDEEPAEEKQSFANKIPFLSSVLKSKNESVDNDDEDGEETKTRVAKNKKSFEVTPKFILLLVVFLAVLFLIEDEQPSEDLTTIPKRKAKEVKNKAPSPAEQDLKNKQAITEKENLEVEKKPMDTNTDSIEQSNIEPKDTPNVDSSINQINPTPNEAEVDLAKEPIEENNLEATDLSEESSLKEDDLAIPSLEGDETSKNLTETKDTTLDDKELTDSNLDLDTQGPSESMENNNANEINDNQSPQGADTDIQGEKTDVISALPNEDQPQRIQNIDDSLADPNSEIQDSSGDITKKLLRDLEKRIEEDQKEQKVIEVLKPVAAPSYEVQGPSLIYNCSGQHWACIDPKSYKKCKQNYSWNKKNALPIECYPYADVNDNFDCATIQQQKIDSVADTSFCN